MALQIGSTLLTMVSWDFRGLSIVLFKAFYRFSIMCMCVCLCVNAWVQNHAEAAGVRFPLGRSYRNFWTAQHGCWEMNSGLWQEQYAFCTLATFPAHTPENLSPFLIAFPLPKGFEHKFFLSFSSPVYYSLQGFSQSCPLCPRYPENLQQPLLLSMTCILPPQRVISGPPKLSEHPPICAIILWF